jgi:hypothetical protein
MILWLISNAVPHDSIWGLRYERFTTEEGTCGYRWEINPADVGKPWAHVYGDDRGMPCCLPAGGTENDQEHEVGWLVEAAEHIAGRSSQQHERKSG